MTLTTSEMLQQVSRSFARCIPLLSPEKANAVENTYLLARILDTIEDSAHPAWEKDILFASFFDVLDDGKPDSFIRSLETGVIDQHDRILCDASNFKEILSQYHSLPYSHKQASASTLREMAKGMSLFLTKEIQSFEDLDAYCYYVAGTVGKYLNQLVTICDKVILSEEKAIAFGKFLQYVNIIKDFAKDVVEGRHFWPLDLTGGNATGYVSGEMEQQGLEALDTMVTHALEFQAPTFAYIKEIPDTVIDYRMCCLLPSLMALRNLQAMAHNPQLLTDPNAIRISATSVLLDAEKACNVEHYLDSLLC